jgi:hypothetical protein
MSNIQYLKLPDNYIYISHLGDNGEYLILPSYPDTIQDSMSSTFASTNALSRSAPVYTYSNSGPREIQFSFTLFRDIMDSYNMHVSNIELEPGQDYVDVLIKKLQAISVPKYNIYNKAVEPPTVAIRLGNEIFIKGIVNGQLTVTYTKPILANNKYSQVTVGFNVTETDPYDAATIATNGSFRGITRAMKKGFHLEE